MRSLSFILVIFLLSMICYPAMAEEIPVLEIDNNTTISTGDMNVYETGQTTWIPVEIWALLFVLAWIFFILGFIIRDQRSIIPFLIAAGIFMILSYATLGMGFYESTTVITHDTAANTYDILIQPSILSYNPIWLSYFLSGMMFFSTFMMIWSIINVFVRTGEDLPNPSKELYGELK